MTNYLKKKELWQLTTLCNECYAIANANNDEESKLRLSKMLVILNNKNKFKKEYMVR